ncbi:hypothetical protein CAPTEDRAFT_218951 [Capitella teleta]|uniref:FAST kinase leucine-rich domain-containing protein n=1 Tax=Capitella teleta TaxID=283909 RepID=R7T9K8_CAPTE|nr:hypothetical protein CAPTEDRAFT_211203 [Capitella teleta]ELU02012.1 hypothetical protein CAPTEDRAFT_218951 [Capitella teleta]|eukprot:ELT87654.1 hypothetical protein CAPTEDRAFT_211203 [Capitella teleta]
MAFRQMSCLSPTRFLLRSSGGILRSFSRHYDKSHRRILGYSSLMVQDGISIKELPMLIRRLDEASFPLTMSYPSERTVAGISQHDAEFQHKLQKCTTLRQVMKILEVPGDDVSAFSSAVAIERLSIMKTRSDDNVDSFIKQAILNELCLTATRGICALSNDMLLRLMSSMNQLRLTDLMGSVQDEMEVRMADRAFTITDLCKIISAVSEDVHCPHDMATAAWVQLGTQYLEINASSISRVYRAMLYASKKEQYIWNLLDIQLRRCIDKMEAEDIATISRCLILGRYRFDDPLSIINQWTWHNRHKLTEDHLYSILTAFVHFNFSPSASYFLDVLCRYIERRNCDVRKGLIALTMDYMLQTQNFNESLFNAVAVDIQNNISKYQPHELFYTLRFFGKMGFLPRNHLEFFWETENYLQEKWERFEPHQLLELLASFVYIQRFPVNPLRNVLTTSFLSRIKEIEDTKIRHQALIHFLELQQAFRQSKAPHMGISPSPDQQNTIYQALKYDSSHRKWQSIIRNTLVHQLNLPPLSGDYVLLPFVIDQGMAVDAKRRIVPFTSPDRVQQIAVIIIHKNEYVRKKSQHAGRLLGQCQFKIRNLQNRGIAVVQVHHNELQDKSPGLADTLRSQLAKYVDLQYYSKEKSTLNPPMRALELINETFVVVRKESKKKDNDDEK